MWFKHSMSIAQQLIPIYNITVHKNKEWCCPKCACLCHNLTTPTGHEGGVQRCKHNDTTTTYTCTLFLKYWIIIINHLTQLNTKNCLKLKVRMIIIIIFKLKCSNTMMRSKVWNTDSSQCDWSYTKCIYWHFIKNHCRVNSIHWLLININSYNKSIFYTTPNQTQKIQKSLIVGYNVTFNTVRVLGWTQIGSDWPKIGEILDILRSVSVHFDSIS